MKIVRALSLLVAATATLAPSTSAAAGFVIDSLDGDITPNEVSSFAAAAAGLPIATSNLGNAMADHGSGPNVEGMRKMYEATGDVAILNVLVKTIDAFVAYKNDEPLGEHRIMWDGNVDPIWPSQAAPNLYAGAESGQVAGHIAYCAYLILETPSLWNQTVPDGDPHGYGVTYLARAKAYLAKVDDSLARYFTPWFVDPATHRIREPTDPRWTACCRNADTAWNRQMMYTLPYLFSARSHDLLGDNPNVLAEYKDIAAQFATWFVASGSYYTSGGRKVVKWYYQIPNDTHIENIGHAQHDVVGLVQTYEAGYTGLAFNQIQPYADTTQFVINLGSTDNWAGNVDGTGTAMASLKTDFIFLAKWNSALYKMVAQSNIDANQINAGGEKCKNTGYILSMKHWMNGAGALDGGSSPDGAVPGDGGTLDDGGASTDAGATTAGDASAAPSDAGGFSNSDGAPAPAGSDGTGASAASSSGNAGGCSCDAAGDSTNPGAAWAGIGLLAAGWALRWRAPFTRPSNMGGPRRGSMQGTALNDRS
jgi:MYXO-CTERM domain-containing protein